TCVNVRQIVSRVLKVLSFHIAGTYGEEPEQLVNGTPTSIQQNPHCVSLQRYGSHMCGCSLIQSQFCVTAAHCLTSIDSSWSILSGTTYLNSGGQRHQIASVYIHPQYDRYAQGRASGYDIGLIKLATPIQFNQNQQPIKLPTRDISSNDVVSVVAWGGMGYRQAVHNDLRKIEAKCMLPSMCQNYHSTTGLKIHSKEFCTLISQGIGTCNGDSGSGVVRKSDGAIVGLVSGGLPCARGYPDVKTNVYSFVPWIKSIVPGI
ncbi:PREDICTED: chymotrypsin-1-like, partial [Dinoponera quadriceps]|uniref:Chymotrypsin-1-like n=1 Tax=Dinoponera quadriceps TaxID=609295 RepID=A0A6P3XUG3_DINQU